MFILHLLIAGLGLHSGLAHVQLTVDKVAMGQIYLRTLQFFSPSVRFNQCSVFIHSSMKDAI